jgi:hypothetical protein
VFAWVARGCKGGNEEVVRTKDWHERDIVCSAIFKACDKYAAGRTLKVAPIGSLKKAPRKISLYAACSMTRTMAHHVMDAVCARE